MATTTPTLPHPLRPSAAGTTVTTTTHRDSGDALVELDHVEGGFLSRISTFHDHTAEGALIPEDPSC